MKKIILFTIVSLFLCVECFTQVVLLQDGKTVTYEPGAELVVTGKTISRVLYDGILITIPKGHKIQIKKKDGKILVSGTNLRDVEIAGKSFSSKGHAIISVSPDDMKVTKVTGDITINKNGSSTRHIYKDNKEDDRPDIADEEDSDNENAEEASLENSENVDDTEEKQPSKNVTIKSTKKS